MTTPENLDHPITASFSTRDGGFPGETQFNFQPMATNLTGDCARLFAADLDDPEARIAEGKNAGKGPDNAQADIDGGRVEGETYSKIRQALGRE